MIKTKKQMFTVVGALALIMLLGEITYAFFNYTRTGVANTIRVGRISFVSEQSGNINLTNAFPISSSEALTDTTNAKSATITITGDTDYAGGVEYVVTADDVHLTVGSGQNAKTLPIAIEISVAGHGTGTLGTVETGDYYTNRDSYTTSKYKLTYDGNLEEGSRILVGYIAPNSTPGVASGVDGTITIKAYIDKSRILISDTYPEGNVDTNNDNVVDYANGTPASMAEGKVVFTTTEWNSIQSSETPLSFKVKVEANEGIWVQSPYADPNNYAANIKCQRVTDATKLHTETCSQTSNYCAGDGYTGDNTIITYGNAKLIGTNTLTVGDAFDCDVDGDGIIDKDGNGNSTERFYYVSEYYNTDTKAFDTGAGYATLIYYSSTYNNGTSVVVSDSGAGYATQADIQAIDSNVTSYDNWHGPVTAVKHLPTTTLWSNITLKTTSRTILACDNGNCSNTPVLTTNNGSNTITNPFSYAGRAARLLTLQEIKHAGCDTLSSKTSLTSTGALKACNFLFEGTQYASSSKGTFGPWLETPRVSLSNRVWYASSGERSVLSYSANYSSYGVRPVIDVLMSDILK